MRSAWTRRCSGFFDRHKSIPYSRRALAKALPDFGSLEAKDFGTFALSLSIHLGVNFVHGSSISSSLVSYIPRYKASELHSRFLMVFQTAVVPQMGHAAFSPWILSFGLWGHRSPRDLHAGKRKSAGDSSSAVSCSSTLTG
jgi:hypothetical protein